MGIDKTKELIKEAQIKASIQAGLAIRKDCEFKIIQLLHLLYDKCIIRHDSCGVLQFDERSVIADNQLGHYWLKMKHER